jgi:hypothetical protein
MLGGAMTLGVAGMPAVAQEETVECTLPPLTLPLFGGTPVAVFASPEASPDAATPDASEEEITAALEQIVACVNSGDPALAYAVFSPGWFAREFSDPESHYLPAFERMLDTGGLPTAEPLVLVQVDGITGHPDGRVEVVATFTSGGSTWNDRLILIESDGVWLIDEVAEAETAP